MFKKPYTILGDHIRTAVSFRTDEPVIHTAIVEAVDILITGDRDFEDLDIEWPEIMSPNAFLERFGIES